MPETYSQKEAEKRNYFPPAESSYFCKSGEIHSVKNKWEGKEYKISESCYRNIDELFPEEG